MKKTTANTLLKLINSAEIEEEKLSDAMHDIKYGLRSTNKYNDYTIAEIKQLFKAYEHIRMYRFRDAANCYMNNLSVQFPYNIWSLLDVIYESSITNKMCKELLQSNRLNSNSPNKKKKAV